MIKRTVVGIGLAITLMITIFMLPSLPRVLQVNAFLVAITLTLLFGETRLALGSAIAGGLIFDLVSSWPFGTWMLAMVAAVALTRWISRTRITNRSFIAYVALTILAVAVAKLAVLGTSHVFSFVDRNALTPTANLAWFVTAAVETLKAAILASIVYVVVRASGRNYATLADHEF